MRIAVYTFISGEYDTLKPFNEDYSKEADFYFFTDHPQEGNWQTVIVPIKEWDERYTARHYKALSHVLFPKYDYAIWIDGSVTLQASPGELVDKYLSNREIASYIYPDEDCIYVHADKCMIAGRFSVPSVMAQIEYYRSEGFPDHAGLCELRVVLRKNTRKVSLFNQLWLDIYKKWLTCDQLCFNYCLWKLGIKYNMIEWGSPEFKTGLHEQYKPHRYDYSIDGQLQHTETIGKSVEFIPEILRHPIYGRRWIGS